MKMPGIVGEPGGDLDRLPGVEPPGVLEPAFPGRRSLAVAADGLPLLLVEVHVVGHVAGVAQSPPLDRTHPHPVVDPLRVEHLAVDRPERAVVAVVGQVERPGHGDLVRHVELRCRPQVVGHPRALVCVAAHPELHDGRRPGTGADDIVAARDRGQQDVLAPPGPGSRPPRRHAGRAREGGLVAPRCGGAGRCRCRPGRTAVRRRARSRRPRRARRSGAGAGSGPGLTRRYGANVPLTRIRLPTVASSGGAWGPVIHSCITALGNGSVSWLSAVKLRSEKCSGTSNGPLGSPSFVLTRVGHEEHALQAAPVVARRPVHPVVVVEAEARRHRLPVVEERVGVGPTGAPADEVAGGLPVVGRALVATVLVNGQGSRLLRQVVDEGDLGRRSRRPS